MDILKKIKDKFLNEIDKVEWEKRDTNDILTVVVNYHEFKEIETISKQISIFLDAYENELPKNYYLEVLSKGANTEIQFSDLDEYIDKYIEITKNNEEKIVGILSKINEEQIVVKVNNKGNFRKNEISKNDIKTINKYIKI